MREQMEYLENELITKQKELNDFARKSEVEMQKWKDSNALLAKELQQCKNELNSKANCNPKKKFSVQANHLNNNNNSHIDSEMLSLKKALKEMELKEKKYLTRIQSLENMEKSLKQKLEKTKLGNLHSAKSKKQAFAKHANLTNLQKSNPLKHESDNESDNDNEDGNINENGHENCDLSFIETLNENAGNDKKNTKTNDLPLDNTTNNDLERQVKLLQNQIRILEQGKFNLEETCAKLSLTCKSNDQFKEEIAIQLKDYQKQLCCKDEIIDHLNQQLALQKQCQCQAKENHQNNNNNNTQSKQEHGHLFANEKAAIEIPSIKQTNPIEAKTSSNWNELGSVKNKLDALTLENEKLTKDELMDQVVSQQQLKQNLELVTMECAKLRQEVQRCKLESDTISKKTTQNDILALVKNLEDKNEELFNRVKILSQDKDNLSKFVEQMKLGRKDSINKFGVCYKIIFLYMYFLLVVDNKSQYVEQLNNQMQNLQAMFDEKLTELRQKTKENLELSRELESTKLQWTSASEELNDIKICYEKCTYETMELKNEIALQKNKEKELKHLCMTLDESRICTEQKLEDLLSENRHLKEKITTKYQIEIQHYEEKVKQLEGKAEELKQALTDFSLSKDSCERELDNKLEIIESLKHQMITLVNDKQQTNSVLFTAQTQMKELQKSNVSFQHESKRLQEQLSMLTSRSEKMCKESHLKTEQILSLSQDLETIAKENEYLQKQLSLAMNDKDGIKLETQRLVNKIIFLENKIKMMETEHRQLLQNYEKIRDENNHYQVIEKDFVKYKHQHLIEAETLMAQMKTRQDRVTFLENECLQLQMNLQTLQKQNQQLTKALEKATHDAERTHQIAHPLTKDFSTSCKQSSLTTCENDNHKSLITILTNEKQQLIKQIQLLQTEKEITFSKLQKAEQQADKLNRMLQTAKTQPTN
ncbi:hypothetical protein RFI_20863 [Reticulomyxa filosa]|uniref:Uncharacterized protein n=1 Tax=Reticulomyxa filosa TaxID=46433 RepID=X6MS35_RETFI|nr:hypothetical protein RFI_20863 [Reticulomyxa filosa]|eukprot:ETO16476.1 hypothetical protein RFI_20863 [Reticulomyxa filosa]